MANRLLTWRLTGLVLWVLALSASIVALVYLPQALSEGGRGTLGYDAAGARFGSHAARRIVTFEPDSPLPAAGIVVGDLIVAPPRGRFAAGERIPLQVVHEGKARVVQVRATRAPYSLAADVGLLFEEVLGVVALVLGTLLILRRWRDTTALALASALLVGGAGLAPMMPPVGMLGAVVIVWSGTALTLAMIMLTWVGLLMAPTDNGAYRWIARCCVGLTVGLLAWIVVVAWYFFGNALPAPEFFVSTVRQALHALALVLCVAAFVRAWRRVEAGQRERLRWLFVGFASGVLALALTVVAIVAGVGESTYVTISLVSDLFVAMALVIFAYAILRQRVIDVGFAINRAIVYALLTGIMLVGFGLVEWLVDHVLEFEQRKNSGLIDGALALGVFLVFHRLQHGIAHTVEHLFFRSWRVRAEVLDRFLEMSEHFTDPGALAKALLEALDAYTESVGSALYGRDAQGRFVLLHATLPHAVPVVGANDLSVVKLKASPTQPLVLEAAAERSVETWAFPLTRRGELVGFVRIGEQRNRDVYRPDQIERVSRAVRQVGFDLYALRLEQAAAKSGVRVA